MPIAAIAGIVAGAAAAAGTAYTVVKTEGAISDAKKKQKEAEAKAAADERKKRSDLFALKFGYAPTERDDLNKLCAVFNGKLECFLRHKDADEYSKTGKTVMPLPRAATTAQNEVATNAIAAANAEKTKAAEAVTTAEKALAAITDVKNLVSSVVGQAAATQQQSQSEVVASARARQQTIFIVAGIAGAVLLVVFLRK